MANIKAIDANSALIEVAADGDGSAANPFVTYHKIIESALPVNAATNEAIYTVRDRLPIAAVNSNVNAIAAATASIQLLASNANRLGAIFYNFSTSKLYLKLGMNASTTSFTVLLNSEDYYELPFRYVGVIHGIWEQQTGNLLVTELT
ncbi:hypothetical protein [Gloeocapsopsis sp. IPPAS B-1203]|uniref:hypothetical protein n=1 Tax=Gloeocapsopsis sp. IPPAS B-1203 TaxID=2049454 RepID=UPI000C18EBF4|nr:hypothetical protein [Gloeocapsopsis sp. IPPAS B-1203]PIG90823.1 hypothetical protein CSQ79_24560 [Gloeocapsopsis sp. IPPAS B-1203]